MKFNFRKIASVLTGAVMLSSTVAFAAAANFPAPFVKSGAGDYAVVYGSTSVAGTDSVAAADINAFLSGKVTTVSEPVVDTNVTMTGDVFSLGKSNDRLNLGDSLNTVYTSVKYDKLTTVLADETFTDEDGTEYDYTQKVDLGSPQLTHFADSEVSADEKPVIGFDIASGTNVLNYTLEFTDAVMNDTSSFDTLMSTNKITFLGKEWYISDVSASGNSITLLDTANEISMIEGSTQTITVGGKSYDVTLDTVESGDTGSVTFKVNGKTYSIKEGNTKKVDTDTFLSVTNKIYSDKKDSKVEFTLGSGELVLEDGNNLQLNDDSIEDVTVHITHGANSITKVKLEWTPEEDKFLTPGKELVMPGVGAVKLSYTGFTFGPSETTKVRYRTDKGIELQDVEVKDGTVDELPLLYSDGTKFTTIGKDSTHLLVTTNATTKVLDLNEDQNSMFVASWANGDEYESYVFQLESVSKNDNENVTKIKNLASGDSALEFKTTDSSVTADKDIGEIKLTVSNVNGAGGTAKVTVTSSSGNGNVYVDRLFTKGGLTINLPVAKDGANAGTNAINFTTNPTSWLLGFQESNKDGDVQSGALFNATLSIADSKTEVSAIDAGVDSLTINSDSDNEEAYVPGEMGTQLLYSAGDDRPTLDVVYHTDESYANVYIAEAGAETGAGNGGSAGSMVVKDTEVSSVSGKNLVVVGGSCVNTVAAKLLGSDTPLCGADFTTATSVGSGAFLISTYASPYSSSKVATLVAGYDAADTTNAANALKTETIDTTVGNKYVKLAGSTLQLV